MLELATLILFSLEHSQHTQFPEFLTGSMHIILDTISIWGVAIIQVRCSLQRAYCHSTGNVITRSLQLSVRLQL
jgi:hypothetical protein